VGGFVTVQHTGAEERGTRTQEERVAQSLLARMRAASGSLGTSDWSERLRASLELADVQLEPIQLVAFTLLGTILVMVVFGALLGAPGVLVGLATPLVVRAWVRRRVARKRTLFAEQLPDNLDVLASALRAGHSLVSALSVVANDAVEPAKSEFQRVIAEEQFGANLEDAFQIVVERMDNDDLDQVALVARLQREVGSNSAEVLDRVVETVRARMELRRLIQTLTAQGRFSRWVLTALPVGLALILTIMGHDYMHPLLSTGVGRLMLLGSALMVALGSWLIGRIVDIKI
jgi:tight adherence protein B